VEVGSDDMGDTNGVWNKTVTSRSSVMTCTKARNIVTGTNQRKVTEKVTTVINDKTDNISN